MSDSGNGFDRFATILWLAALHSSENEDAGYKWSRRGAKNQDFGERVSRSRSASSETEVFGYSFLSCS